MIAVANSAVRPEQLRRAAVSRHVLIVEDQPESRESLRRLLALYGHHVDVAGDGYEAVELGLAGRHEIVVIDIGLPGQDGYEVARRLRSNLGNRVCLIAYTAYGQPENRTRALAAGFDVFLIKPDGLSELLRRLTIGSR